MRQTMEDIREYYDITCAENINWLKHDFFINNTKYVVVLGGKIIDSAVEKCINILLQKTAPHNIVIIKDGKLNTYGAHKILNKIKNLKEIIFFDCYDKDIYPLYDKLKDQVRIDKKNCKIWNEIKQRPRFKSVFFDFEPFKKKFVDILKFAIFLFIGALIFAYITPTWLRITLYVAIIIICCFASSEEIFDIFSIVDSESNSKYMNIRSCLFILWEFLAICCLLTEGALKIKWFSFIKPFSNILNKIVCFPYYVFANIIPQTNIMKCIIISLSYPFIFLLLSRIIFIIYNICVWSKTYMGFEYNSVIIQEGEHTFKEFNFQDINHIDSFIHRNTFGTRVSFHPSLQVGALTKSDIDKIKENFSSFKRNSQNIIVSDNAQNYKNTIHQHINIANANIYDNENVNIEDFSVNINGDRVAQQTNLQETIKETKSIQNMKYETNNQRLFKPKGDETNEKRYS